MKKVHIQAPAGTVFSARSADGPESLTVETESMIEMQHEGLRVSDGYHTFDELYDHRITLYIALCKVVEADDFYDSPAVWRSKRHADNELCFGTGTEFILGIGKAPGKQISYHIPIERWDETNFAETLDRAPEWDKHTPEDVLARLKLL